MVEHVSAAREYLLGRCKDFPQTVIILGSGMSEVLIDADVETSIPFGEIPHVPSLTVRGHSGCLQIARVGAHRVAIARGRLHYYEGHSMQTVVLPVRAMALAGGQRFILTNAAGACNPGRKPPALMLIKDHLNMMGTSPLIGPNVDAWGERFPDMTRAYDPAIRSALKAVARELGMDLPEGVYAGNHGPAFETPAEVAMYRTLGADVVGMSTVPEVLALHHMGRRVGAISCITNLAAGVSPEVQTHEEVLQNAAQVQGALGTLLKKAIEVLHG